MEIRGKDRFLPIIARHNNIQFTRLLWSYLSLLDSYPPIPHPSFRTRRPRVSALLLNLARAAKRLPQGIAAYHPSNPEPDPCHLPRASERQQQCKVCLVR